MLCIYVERCFESLICWLDLCLSCLIVAFIFMYFPFLWKTLFLKLDSFSTDPQHLICWLDLCLSCLIVAFIFMCFSSLKNSCSSGSIAFSTDFNRFRFYRANLLCLDSLWTNLRSIEISVVFLNAISIASR